MPDAGTKVLVPGGGGFIGSHLAARLLADGCCETVKQGRCRYGVLRGAVRAA